MRKCPETITIYRCLHIVEAKDIREKIDIVKLNVGILWLLNKCFVMGLIRLLQKSRCNYGRSFSESVFWHGYMETSRTINNRIT